MSLSYGKSVTYMSFWARFWSMVENPDPWVCYLNGNSHVIRWMPFEYLTINSPVFRWILILGVWYSDNLDYVRLNDHNFQINFGSLVPYFFLLAIKVGHCFVPKIGDRIKGLKLRRFGKPKSTYDGKLRQP